MESKADRYAIACKEAREQVTKLRTNCIKATNAAFKALPQQAVYRNGKKTALRPKSKYVKAYYDVTKHIRDKMLQDVENVYSKVANQYGVKGEVVKKIILGM
jgi:hypothetical protein